MREAVALGTIILRRTEAQPFTEQQVALLQTFADQAVIAIENVRLFNELEERNQALTEALEQQTATSEILSVISRSPTEVGPVLAAVAESAARLCAAVDAIILSTEGPMMRRVAHFGDIASVSDVRSVTRDTPSGEVRADERKIRQVVLNLLSNAIKFTPEGGRIEVGALPRDGSVEVSVTDTGVGIAPEDQEAVFEEFRQVGTAERKAEGTGLGLTLCRKFVELHGGRIRVTSQVGVGSTFTFTIPVRGGE
jgi:signal transduction histidine kinase